MDFRNGKELLDLCREHNLLISEVMREREITCGNMTNEQINARLKEILTIMKNAAHTPLDTPTRSIGGLIGGEAKKTYEFSQTDNNLCGTFLSRAISYSMAVLEVNATMGLIVADLLLVQPVSFRGYFLHFRNTGI